MRHEHFVVEEVIFNVSGKQTDNFFDSFLFYALSSEQFFHLRNRYVSIVIPCYQLKCIFYINQIVLSLFDLENLDELLKCDLFPFPKCFLADGLEIFGRNTVPDSIKNGKEIRSSMKDFIIICQVLNQE